MRLIDDSSECNFLNNRCEWPIKSCDLPIMRPNNANDRKSACAIDERLSRHLPFVQPLAARGQFIGFEARRDKPGREGTLQDVTGRQAVVASPGPSIRQRRIGAFTYPHSIRKQCVGMAPRSWELIALSLLAGLGLGLALDRGDLIFVAVFGAACGMAIIGGMQRFP
jgi:hypothetical protein